MGKNRSKKRRLEQQTLASSSSIAASLLSKAKKKQSQVEERETDDDISPQDLATTIRTLDSLAALPGDLWHDVLHKNRDLKRALFPFGEAMRLRWDPVDYPARVTFFLGKKSWGDALCALEACAYYGSGSAGNAVKRGTVQRWVRQCDDCDRAGMRFKLISAILKCTSEESSGERDTMPSTETMNLHDPKRVLQSLEGQEKSDGNNSDNDYEHLVTRRSTWSPPTALEKHETTKASYQDTQATLPSEIKVVHHIVGCDRKPPNHYDLKIFSTSSIPMSTNTMPVQRHDIISIPGALLLRSVLTHDECRHILQVAQHMGFVPDHPVSAAHPTGIDTCEWLADDSTLQTLSERVLSKLPQTVEGGTVAGINARWRLFQYGPGAVYRPHIDGSWPSSGLDANGVYQTDVSNGTCRSRMTFLIYLNDDFEGGETTFYLSTKGGLEAVAVKPEMGSVLCFPQGNTASLVHEGSHVKAGACKYVIRTDVLYHCKPATTES